MDNQRQTEFFQLLQSKTPKNSLLVDQLSQLLGLSAQGAYKKIQGRTKLSFSEIEIICQHYDISFDSFVFGELGQPNAYPFYSDALKFVPSSFHEYWLNLLNHLKEIEKMGEIESFILCNEIPFFHFLPFQHLLNYKMLIWNKTSWHIPLLGKNAYQNVFVQDKALQSTISCINDIYCNQKTIEIWNPDILRFTYMQLEYSIEEGYFDKKEDLLNILDDIDKMIQHMNKCATLGSKTLFGASKKKGKMDIYLNHLCINSETIFVKSDKSAIVYHKYDAPNYIRTTDKRVCYHAEYWFSNILNKAVLISEKCAGQRNIFFKNLYNSLDKQKNALLALIDAKLE